MTTWVPWPWGNHLSSSGCSVSLTTSALFLVVSILSTSSCAGLRFDVLEMMSTGLPVVMSPYMPAAEMPMPCWPRDIFMRWNFEPYSSWPKMCSICFLTIPGPLSRTVILKRVSASARTLT